MKSSIWELSFLLIMGKRNVALSLSMEIANGGVHIIISKKYQYMHRRKTSGRRRRENTRDLPEFGGGTVGCVVLSVGCEGYVIFSVG